MTSKLKIYAVIQSFSILLILSIIIMSLSTCGDNDDAMKPEQVQTAPAKLEIMMSPKVSIEDITLVRLTITGDNMEPIETPLVIDKATKKANGSISVPIGTNRIFKVEVFAGNFLRFIGEQRVDIQNATSVKIPVSIKAAEGIGVIAISEQTKNNGQAIAIGDLDIFLSSSAGNVKFVQNLAKSVGSAPRLKIDISRGTAITQQTLQNLESALRKGGFQTQIDESLVYDRSKFDAVLFVLPTENFDSGQLDAISQFVKGGGVLILVADTDENLDPLNVLANVFGIRFEYSLVNVPGGDPASLVLNNLSTSPLFDGVASIVVSNARSISLKPDVTGETRVINGATPGAGGIVVSDEPKLSISPSSADLGELLTSAQFDIANIGTGTLSWNIVTDPPLPDWLSITPENADVPAGQKRSVTATVDRSGLDPGEFSHTVQVKSNAGDGRFTVTMRVPEPSPSLSLSPLLFNFGTTKTQDTLTITNKGGGTLNWQATKGQSWLSLSATNGSLTAGKSQSITLTVNRAGVNPGSFIDTISFTSNGGNNNVVADMTVPEPEPSLSFTPASVNFGTTNTQASFTILNTGGGTLNWQVAKQQFWLTLSPTTGSLAAGRSQAVTLTVNRGDLKAGTFADVVSITTNVGSGNVNVSMTVVEPDPSLSFTPASINFGATDTQKVLTITNRGGGTLTWQATKTQAWLTLSATSGSLTAGNSQNVTLTASRANLNPGTVRDTISLTSNGGSGSVAVTMTVPEPVPALSFTPATIDFGVTDTQKTLAISNKGGGTLTWQATKTQSWLSLSAPSGSLSSGNSQNITLTINRAGLKPGKFSDTVSLTSNGGSGSVAISMTVPEPSPVLAFTPTSLDFGTSDLQKTFIITNNGGGSLNWQAAKGQTWLTLSQSTGTLNTGASVSVIATINRTALKGGSFTDNINLTSNGGSGIVLVIVKVPSLASSPTALSFGTTETKLTFNVSNVGAGALAFQASKKQTWLTLSSTSGSLDDGKSISITATVSRVGLQPGSFTDTIAITSNGGNANISVTMTVPEPTPILAFAPNTFDFGTAETQKILTITNNGGGTLNWQATKTQSWLSLSVFSGSLTSGNSQNVTLIVNRVNLNPGSFKDTISLTSNGGNGSVAVTMAVPEPAPVLSFSPSSLDFGTTTTQLEFTVVNRGGGTLTWQAAKGQAWISFSSANGSLTAGKSQIVTATVNRSGLNPNTYKDTITLTSNGGNGSISVNMVVPLTTPSLVFTPATLDFGTVDTQKTIAITNNGGGTLTWQALRQQTWLTLSPAVGSLEAGKSVNVTVTVSRLRLNPGTYKDNVSITSNAGSGLVAVTMTVPVPAPALSLSTTALDFGADSVQQTFVITNSGGGTLTWQAAKQQAWLSLSSASGSLTAGASVTITARADRATINPGTQTDKISITSNGGNGSISVSLLMPGLRFTPASLAFGSADTQKTFTITNTGAGILSWKAAKKETWLTLSSSAGTLGANATTTVTVTVSRDGLKFGDFVDTINLTSNGGSGAIRVTMPIPGLAFTPVSLDFGSSDTSKILKISNAGGGTLNWKIEKRQAWVTLTPSSGAILAGASVDVTVAVSRTGLLPSTFSDILVISSDGGGGNVPVNMSVAGFLVSPLTLDFGSIDTQKTVTINNNGGGPVTWQSSKKEAWLTITPANGTVDAGKIVNVNVTVSRTGLKPGSYADTIIMTSAVGERRIAVSMAVAGLSFTPTAINFGSINTRGNLSITNTGGGALSFALSKTQPWISLSQSSGFVQAGKTLVVTVTADRNLIPPGTQRDIITITSNGGNGSVPVTILAPGLGLSPISLDFGSLDTQKTFTITNTGAGSLVWNATKIQPWLSFAPISGTVDAGLSATVTVNVSRVDLAPGDYSDNIVIAYNGGTGSVSVKMGIPKLDWTPSLLDFGTSLNQRTFTITNSGGGILAWQASKGTTTTWLTMTPSGGNVNPGQTVIVTVAVSRTGVLPGTHIGTISLTSNGGSGSVVVQMSLPGLSYTPNSLSFAENETDKTLTITNSGGGALTWTAAKTQTWLSLSLLSGSVDAGKSVVIGVSVARGTLKPGIYQDIITLTTNGGNAQVPVSMNIPNPSLSVTPTLLAFGDTATQRSFTITNTGGGTLDWTLKSAFPFTDPPIVGFWLSATPLSGSLSSGSSATVTVSVSRMELKPGDYRHNMPITSNAGTQNVTITMTVPGPSLSLSPTKLDFGSTLWEQEFRITNTGAGTLSWTATSNRVWLQVSRNPQLEDWADSVSGTVGPYGSTTVHVLLVHRDFAGGIYNGAINVTSNGSPVANGSVAVSMTVPQIIIGK